MCAIICKLVLFISVPPPALFIASRSRWVTATNSLTRYGFLQSRLESHWSAQRCCRRTHTPGIREHTTGNNEPKTLLQKSVHDPEIIPISGDLCVLKSFPPAPSQVVSRSVCSGFYSPTKGKVNLWRASSPPPPPLLPHLRHGCPVGDVKKHKGVFEINKWINQI